VVDEDKALAAPFATEGTGAVEKWRDYVFNLAAETVHVDGVLIPLTAKEFALALLLFRNLSQPLSRNAIFAEVWGRELDATSRALDALISQVRNRLRLRPEKGFRLSAVYGFGYRLERLSDWEGTAPRGVDRHRPGALRVGRSTTN